MNRLAPALAGTALVAATALAATPPATAQTAAPADAAVVSAAASWLTAQLDDGYRVEGEYGPSYGQGADVALALLASGGHDENLGQLLSWLEANAADYTQGTSAIEFGEKPGAAYVGATAKLAMTVEVTGGDATDVAGLDLLAQLSRLQQPSGRFADDSAFGDFANLYGHAFAVLAFEAAGAGPGQEVVDALLASQCPDGSFPETYPADETTCTGQVDATGLVLQALAAAGLGNSAEAAAAVSWLDGQQAVDGSFPGEASVNSTGYAVLGLDAVGATTDEAVAWLTGQQNPDGGLPRGAVDDAGDSDFYATAQALPALAGTTFLGAARDVQRVALPAPPAEPSPTEPAPTEPAPTEPEPTEPEPTEPEPEPTEPAPTTPAPTATETPSEAAPAPTSTTTRTGAAPATTRSSSGSLPRTGRDALPAVGAGAALVLLGGVLLLATRRRGDHA